MPALLPQPDPDGLLEYSVVYTDRALNHMSKRFQGVMKDISRILRTVYNGSTAIVVPGSGTFGMEAVARQFATDRKCLVIRNGWFSFRWTQIFEMGRIPAASIVMKARRLADDIVFMHDGRITEHTPADVFFRQAQSREADDFLKGELP